MAVPPDMMYPGASPALAGLLGADAGPPPDAGPPMAGPPGGAMAPPEQAIPGGGASDEVEEYKSVIEHITYVMDLPSVTEQERATMMKCVQAFQDLLAQNEKMEEQAGANPALRKLSQGV